METPTRTPESLQVCAVRRAGSGNASIGGQGDTRGFGNDRIQNNREQTLLLKEFLAACNIPPNWVTLCKGWERVRNGGTR
jgi:hypothetical protein